MLDTRVSKLEEQRAVRRPRIEKRERAHAALNAKVDEILAKGI
jgi:hypothetical protein